jgi:D-alanyl-D-alanine dipeptidase
MLKVLILCLLPFSLLAKENSIKLIDVKTLESTIMVKMNYFTTDNFVGVVVDGYKANTCLLSKPAATALARAQVLAQKKNLSLLVHDCYRPQRGVDHFIRWSNDAKDIKTKKKYYPNIIKNKLFKLGYIATKSGHSRGSTVDLTLYDLKKKTSMEMGTIYDFLDPLSNTINFNISKEAQSNRQILVDLMATAGFKNYSKEWWHFTLNDEPNKNIYLDIIIK